MFNFFTRSIALLQLFYKINLIEKLYVSTDQGQFKNLIH